MEGGVGIETIVLCHMKMASCLSLIIVFQGSVFTFPWEKIKSSLHLMQFKIMIGHCEFFQMLPNRTNFPVLSSKGLTLKKALLFIPSFHQASDSEPLPLFLARLTFVSKRCRLAFPGPLSWVHHCTLQLFCTRLGMFCIIQLYISF